METHGSGLKLAGQGRKTNLALGSTLVALGSTGGVLNAAAGKVMPTILGGILTGIGSALLIKARKQKNKNKSGSGVKEEVAAFNKAFKKVWKQNMGQGGRGKKHISLKEVLKQHGDKPVHIEEVFGDKWRDVSNQILDALKQHSGKGMVGSGIGKTMLNKFKKFLNGKTKFKPSTLLNVAAGVTSAITGASAFIPGLDFISVPAGSAASLALKGAATVLEQTGRGKIVAGDRCLHKKCMQRGKGTSLAGGNIYLPESVRNLIKKYPNIAKKVVEFVFNKLGRGDDEKQKDDSIPDTPSKLARMLSIALRFSKAAFILYKFLIENPELKDSVLDMISLYSPNIPGSGAEEVPYGISYTKTGKIKRDRYSVYYGYHKTTAGGLTKDDFIKKGKKIVSKKKSEMGKQRIQNLMENNTA